MNESTYYDLLNPCVEIELGPKDKPMRFKARKVGAGLVVAEAEAAVLSQRISAAREAAQEIPQDERAAFLIQAFESLPAGRDLQRMALSYLATINGTARALWHALDKDQKPCPTLEDVRRLVWMSDPADIRALIHLLCEL